MLLLLAGKQKPSARSRVHVVLIPATISVTPTGACSGTGNGGEPVASRRRSQIGGRRRVVHEVALRRLSTRRDRAGPRDERAVVLLKQW